jgi:hypothetical protein
MSVSIGKEMTQLNQQTVKITQQNALNAKSEQRRLSFARRQDSGARKPDRHIAYVAA